MLPQLASASASEGLARAVHSTCVCRGVSAQEPGCMQPIYLWSLYFCAAGRGANWHKQLLGSWRIFVGVGEWLSAQPRVPRTRCLAFRLPGVYNSRCCKPVCAQVNDCVLR